MATATARRKEETFQNLRVSSLAMDTPRMGIAATAAHSLFAPAAQAEPALAQEFGQRPRLFLRQAACAYTGVSLWVSCLIPDLTQHKQKGNRR